MAASMDRLDQLFFSFADFFSIVERKNPVGLILAFARAFQPGEGPVLVIKTINGGARLNDLSAYPTSLMMLSSLAGVTLSFDTLRRKKVGIAVDGINRSYMAAVTG